jgi:radical SAM superfamily enzyme YgiQ (UPF0313 family)
MKGGKVVFIAYQDQENLGVGYLSSMLLSCGFDVEIVDFGLRNEEICRRVKKADPLMVGFSLIFQYHSLRLRDLASYLRENSVDCHFTVGGHYPSLRFEDILNIVPDMDSVVRFEGELTVCDLAKRLSLGEDWSEIDGIAFRRNGKPVSNRLRPLISDLDSLPFPVRSKKSRIQCMGKNCAFMLASRGCVRNCSFCSIRRFYQTPPGWLRRSRRPQNVVEEMKELYKRHRARIFLFQDDDFILPGKLGKRWVFDFIKELESRRLADKIIWKISCRPDEVEFDLFSELKEAGLRLVYLGIESGNPKGLEVLNKQLSVEDNFKAIQVLNRLMILYDFGFMLFDPSSTFESVRKNIVFLKKICRDGTSPVAFCKMIPYAETDVEKRLASEGRLKGSVVNPDYDFLDPKLDEYYEFLRRTFYDWMFTQKGILAQLHWHRFEVAALKKFYPYAKRMDEYEDFLKGIIASSNKLFFHVAEKSAPVFEENKSSSEDQLSDLAEFQRTELAKINSRLLEGMVEFQRQQ